VITLLTATGGRPESWAICERLMLAQTYEGPVHWVIVDDGEQPQEITFARHNWTLEVVRPMPFWRSGENTQARNLLAGLEVIDANAQLVIIEDDDYYSPDWLRFIDSAFFLSSADLIGESNARYYNVQTGIARELSNLNHASLCSSAMRGPAIQSFFKACQKGAKFIDVDLWASCEKKLLFYEAQVVGIKGMPGRDGIGMGHKSLVGQQDQESNILKQWLGKDADFYLLKG